MISRPTLLASYNIRDLISSICLSQSGILDGSHIKKKKACELYVLDTWRVPSPQLIFSLPFCTVILT